MQGTNEEVSPDTSMCYLVRRVKSGSYGVSPERGKVVRSLWSLSRVRTSQSRGKS